MVSKFVASAAFLVSLLLPVLSVAAEEPIEFNDTRYHQLAVDQDAKHYYPADQETENWVQRLSLVRLSVPTDDQYSTAVEQTISSYPDKAVTVIRDYPVEGSSGNPEHLLVLVSKGDSFLELSASRFLIIDKQAVVFSFSRREYGSGVGATLSRWMQENGESLEEALVNQPVVQLSKALDSH